MNPDDLQSILADRFNRTRWLEVVREVLPGAATYLTPQVVEPEATRAKSIWQLGEVSLADDKNLAVLEVEVAPGVDLARNRAGLRALAARFIDQASYHGVLAVFRTEGRDDWRLTFAARESAFDPTAAEFTSSETAPRRYTYLLGPGETCRTPAERLLALRGHGRAAKLANIVEAFSVEELNKEFFSDFCKVFNFIAAELDSRFPEWKKNTVTHDLASQETQILLNRLLFLYFVQRKGWLHRDTRYLVKHFREHHESRDESASYYEKFLFPVFRILSTEWMSREKTVSHLPDHDPHRHDLPFLNGGLFHDDDLNDDASRRRKKLGISNDTFACVFEDLLERYNFTIREDSPLDQEVAIDPEMLGKIFEELILREESGNTGSGKSKRHDTGSHYTPRPIVHYLCREALAAWLKNQPPFAARPDASEKITSLLILDAAEGLDDDAMQTLRGLLTPEEAGKLLHSLDDLRACDPAVGSGAFPIGLLHELLNLAHLADSRARGHDPAAGELTWAYDTKKDFIRRSIYGVDIQERATEICKLRLWLSLMVDHDLGVNPAECDRRSFQNALRKLEPLPNLDYKIRRADSLIDRIHGEPVNLGKLHDSSIARPALGALASAKIGFFNADSAVKKREMHLSIFNALTELSEIALRDARNDLGLVPGDENNARIAELERARAAVGADRALVKAAMRSSAKVGEKESVIEQLRARFDDPSKPTFVWQLDFAEVFHRERRKKPNSVLLEERPAGNRITEKGGFDILLANPPFVRQEKIVELKPLLESRYDCFAGSADLYVYFYELGIRLLREHGVISYISSNSFLNSGFGKRLRLFLKQRTTICILIDFAETGVFTAVNEPSIFVAILGYSKSNEFRAVRWPLDEKATAINEVVSKRAVSVSQDSLRDDAWLLESKFILELLDRMRENTSPLGKIVHGGFYYGIKTGLNKAFHISEAERSEIIRRDPNSESRIQPLLRGGDIKRWVADAPTEYLIRIESSENFSHPWTGQSEEEAEKTFASHCPAFFERFYPMRKQLKARQDQGQYYWELRSCAYWDTFRHEKIVYQDIARHLGMCWDESGTYPVNTCYFIPGAKKWILGVLLSRPMRFYVERTLGSDEGGFLRLFTIYVEKFPIPKLNEDQILALESLVDCIIYLYNQSTVRESISTAPRDPLIAQYFEQWVDGMVYQLFFPQDLKAARLDFFKLFEDSQLPGDENWSRTDRLAQFRLHFERLYDPNHPLRGSLFALQSLELVRIIEGEE